MSNTKGKEENVLNYEKWQHLELTSLTNKWAVTHLRWWLWGGSNNLLQEHNKLQFAVGASLPGSWTTEMLFFMAMH